MLKHLLGLCGVGLRLWLFSLPKLTSLLSLRPEISTPTTAWNRLIEGVALFKHSGLLHDGDSYHGSSLMLIFAATLQNFSPVFINACFVICDVISAVALYYFAQNFLCSEMKAQTQSKKKFAGDVDPIVLKEHHINTIPLIVCMIYIFNPFTIATCVSKSTLTITNMCMALFLYEASSGNIIRMTLFLSLATYESLYPVQLIIPAALCYYKYQNRDQSLTVCMFKTTLCSLMWMILLLFLSYSYERSLSSTLQHFTFLLTVPDQSPNVGVFWYFFTEIFDHFQTFFICVFQLNVVVFSIPMSIKLRSHPVCLTFMLIGIISCLKSYPSVGDAGLWLSIIPLWSHTFKYLRLPFVTYVMLVTSAILCPVMWNMWINAHSANANFFFAATLAYTTAQVLILTDMLLAYLKWHYHLHNGLEPLVPGSNEKAVIRLKN